MILIEATPEQSRDRDRATFEAWGGQLPLERYLAETERLRRHPWSRAAESVWCLCADDGDVLSSCETYRMASFLDQGRQPGHTYGIASVYTEPGKRRRGHCLELLRRLGDRLVRGDPDAQALVLFSDVALATYGKAGFAARPALSLVLEAMAGDPRDGVEALLAEHQAGQALARIPRPAGPFTVWPGAEQIDWHLERERIFADLLGRPRPVACGATVRGATALWSADYREGQLTVLLWHAPDAEEAEALFACARRVAGGAGLARVAVWQTPQAGLPGRALLEDRLRQLDSVPMIRPLDSRVLAAHWAWIPRAIWV
jgi:hypothetical protein